MARLSIGSRKIKDFDEFLGRRKRRRRRSSRGEKEKRKEKETEVEEEEKNALVGSIDRA